MLTKKFVNHPNFLITKVDKENITVVFEKNHYISNMKKIFLEDTHTHL